MRGYVWVDGQPNLSYRAEHVLVLGPWLWGRVTKGWLRVSGVVVLPWSSLLPPSHFPTITAHASPSHSLLLPWSLMLSLLLSFTNLCLSSETASSVGPSLAGSTALELASLLIRDALYSLLFKVGTRAYNVIILCVYDLSLLHKTILEPWEIIDMSCLLPAMDRLGYWGPGALCGLPEGTQQIMEEKSGPLTSSPKPIPTHSNSFLEFYTLCHLSPGLL